MNGNDKSWKPKTGVVIKAVLSFSNTSIHSGDHSFPITLFFVLTPSSCVQDFAVVLQFRRISKQIADNMTLVLKWTTAFSKF